MKAIKDNVIIQIEITNACNLGCANCSRLVGHHAKPFFMTLDEVRNAINSLDGFPGRIGMMGGEPTLHPKFSEICDIFIEMIPDKRKREFWTDGFKWDEYKEKIHETFDEDLIAYNDHSKPDEGWHQPLLIAIDEVVDDKEKMWSLINNCWVQRRWSASITPKGAFFCEVAGALDYALNGPGGWPIEKDWWKRTPKDYLEQKLNNCVKCSAALPMAEIPNNHVNHDLVSHGMNELLLKNGSPKAKRGCTKTVDKSVAIEYLESVPSVEPGERGYLKSHPDWRPSEFRTKTWHCPGEGKLTSNEVRKLQRSLNSSKNIKGVKNKKIATIRESNCMITIKSLEKAKLEIRPEIIKIVKENLLNTPFEGEESIISYIEQSLNEELTVRERDLIIKYSMEPAFRN